MFVLQRISSFDLRVTNADGRCLNTIISPVHNMKRLWDGPALNVPVIRIRIRLVKLTVKLLEAFWRTGGPNQKVLPHLMFRQVLPTEFNSTDLHCDESNYISFSATSTFISSPATTFLRILQ